MPDSQHLRMKRTAYRTMDAYYPVEWGTVTAYDPAGHTAKVRIHDGRPTPHLPINTPPGVRPTIPVGTLVKVAYDRGVPTSIVETHYDDGAAPSAGLALQDEAHFSGPVTFYSTLQLTPSRTTGHPATGTHNQGELMMDVAGSMFACVVSGTPGTWKQITLV